MSDRLPLIFGPARVFIDGKEVNAGMDSMRWTADGGLVSEQDVEIVSDVESEPFDLRSLKRAFAADQDVPEGGVIDLTRPLKVQRSGTITVKLPTVPLPTRVWCALWHGHWPAQQRGFFDFARDHWSCRCGKVSMGAEELLDLSARYSRRPPF